MARVSYVVFSRKNNQCDRYDDGSRYNKENDKTKKYEDPERQATAPSMAPAEVLGRRRFQ